MQYGAGRNVRFSANNDTEASDRQGAQFKHARGRVLLLSIAGTNGHLRGAGQRFSPKTGHLSF